MLVKVIAWFVVIFGIYTTSDILKLLYVISRAVRRVKYETVLKYHEWYCSCLSSLHYLSSPRWINRYWRHIAVMGGEGVTLRWTIWTNIPPRGEYAACCKNLVNLQLYGFCQGRRSPERLKKKKVLPPPPPTSPQLPPFKSLAAPLPSPPLGKLFRLPYSLARFWLYQYTQFKLNVRYLFIYAVTLVAGLYGMLPGSYLILH